MSSVSSSSGGGHVDWEEQARVAPGRKPRGFHATLNNRPGQSTARITHVRYADVHRRSSRHDPGFLRELQRAVRLPTPRLPWRNYLQNNKADRYGKFRYSTDVIARTSRSCTQSSSPNRKRSVWT